MIKQNLHLIRTRAVWDSAQYYEAKTEVLVFGDVGAYRAMMDVLRLSKPASSWIGPYHSTSTSNSMSLAIAPPAQTGPNAQLRLFERPIFVENQAKMELIIYGNQKGYRWLADHLELAAIRGVDDADYHIHLDDWSDAEVLPRSVSLNIRGPLKVWNVDALGHWGRFVKERQSTYLPPDLDAMSVEYAFPILGGLPDAREQAIFIDG